MSPGELLDAVKEIIVAGCGCDRHCLELLSGDFYCGCEDDARKIIDLVKRETDNFA